MGCRREGTGDPRETGPERPREGAEPDREPARRTDRAHSAPESVPSALQPLIGVHSGLASSPA